MFFIEVSHNRKILIYLNICLFGWELYHKCYNLIIIFILIVSIITFKSLSFDFWFCSFEFHSRMLIMYFVQSMFIYALFYYKIQLGKAMIIYLTAGQHIKGSKLIPPQIIHAIYNTQTLLKNLMYCNKI